MKIKIEFSTGKTIELTREEFVELTGQPLYIPIQTYPIYPTWPTWYSSDQTTTETDINFSKRPRGTVRGYFGKDF